YPSGKLLSWTAADPINTPSTNTTLTATPTSVVASSDGTQAWVASGTADLQALNLGTTPITATPFTVTGTTLSQLALLSSTAPDRLAGAGGTTLHIIDPTQTTPLVSATLAAP